MATNIQSAANNLVASGCADPAVYEQVANYVLTGRGYDPAGNARIPKSVEIETTSGNSMATEADWLLNAADADLTLNPIIDPIGIEKVGQTKPGPCIPH